MAFIRAGVFAIKLTTTQEDCTEEIDNELIDAVKAYISGRKREGEERIPLKEVFEKKVLVPTYYDS